MDIAAHCLEIALYETREHRPAMDNIACNGRTLSGTLGANVTLDLLLS